MPTALRDQYVDSLASCEVQTVRLVAAPDIVRERLHDRRAGAGLQRNPRTQAEQDASLEVAAIEDFTVVNDRPASMVAREVIALAGWLSPAE